MKLEEFIGSAIVEMSKNKTKIIIDGTLGSVSLCEGEQNGWYGGYFLEKSRNSSEFCIGAKKPLLSWVKAFVHEYCHFKQKKEKSKVWGNQNINGRDSLSTLEEWFENQIDLTEEEVVKFVRASAEVERDCEIRTIRILKNLELPKNFKVDIKKYSKEANSYIAYYFTIPKLKTWCKTSPFQVKQIMDVMPNKIEGINHEELAKKYFHLYEKYCKEEGNENC